jgi:phospholipid/cholesterol/gamma-HCH transport system ATP-binding protein
VTIRLHEVHKSFGTQKVLDGISFEVPDGGSLALMGPSGSGKSVILKHVIGLLQPDSGTVEVLGKDLAKLKGEALRELRRDMGYLFQHSALINWLDVFENVALPLRETTSMREPEIRARVMQVLTQVDMEDARAKLPGEISGGMQKRVGLARALVTDPKVILYDEPEAGLDPQMSASVSRLIRRLRNELGTTSITVTHSIDCAREVADTLAVFDAGRLIAVGPPDEVLASDVQRVREFLGQEIH